MNRYQVTDELALAVASEVRKGNRLHQVASSMQIDVETAALAYVRWSVIESMPASR